MYHIRRYDPRFPYGTIHGSGDDLAALIEECDRLNAAALQEEGYLQWWVTRGDTLAIYPHQMLVLEVDKERLSAALDLVKRYGQGGGEVEHLKWILDQTVRLLTGPDYQKWVEEYVQGGERTWEEGRAP